MSRYFSGVFVGTLLILFALSGTTTRAGEPLLKELTAEEFKKGMDGAQSSMINLSSYKEIIADPKAVILDVRSKESFAREHIDGSKNLPLTDITEKTIADVAPDKTAPVILICDDSFFPVRMIALTMQAYPSLKTYGYQNVYQLRAWQGNNGTMDARKELNLVSDNKISAE